jgi:pimeloyl-ACP methyl ester carboxylesterase
MTQYADQIPAHLEHRFTLRDGRTLAAAEWGDPDGLPLISIHGTPGGRIGWWKDPTIYHRFGIRRITFDRAGYGESTRNRGRSVVDVVPDVEQLADALGFERFVVAGGSGGGPHALAVAALLPDRVIRCQAAVSVAPYEALGDAWVAGMTEGNVVEFNAARAGEAALNELCTDLRLMNLKRLQEERLDWMGDDYELSESDKAQEQRHFVRTRAHIANALSGSADGWVDDNLAMVKPWGFDVAQIRVPVLLTYGRTDVLVPAAHGDWLAAHVPGAIAWVDDESGHMGADEHIEREYAWLTGRPA